MDYAAQHSIDARKPRYQRVSVNLVTDNDSVQRTPSSSRIVSKDYGWFRFKNVAIRNSAYVSLIIVPLALAIFLPTNIDKLINTDIFEGTPLGGSLTLTQAKAVDFVSSAVLAPLLLSIFNYIWFRNARISIAHEAKKTRIGTSLYALVQASGTSSGTYDIFKIWTMCCSRSGRLMVFATLALLSAMSKSTLSNIIAYEAFTQLTPAPSSHLRTLTGPLMNNTDGDVQGFEPYKSEKWVASHDQRRVYIQETTSVMQQVAWENSTYQLDSGAYVALNVTTADISNLNSSVMGLHDVPAIRATAQCTPHNLTSASIWVHNQGVGLQVQFDRYTDTNETSQNLDWYIASVPATTTVFIDGDTRSSPYRSLNFLAYNFDATSMLIGTLGADLGGDPAWTEPNLVPIQSRFGEIPAQNFSIYLDNNATSPTSTLFWVLQCTINQQIGLVNMSRNPSNDEWHRSNASWSNATQIYPSVLANLYDSLGVMSFVSAKSGLAYALTPSAQVQACNISDTSTTVPSWCNEPGARTLDFQTMADNLLYAEMEIQRLSYEVAALNQTLASQDMYIDVTTFGNVLRYRITYIPALVFAGMVCVFFAAVATVALMIYSRNSISSRASRQVDSLRLLVDYAVNNHDAQLTAAARLWNEDELQNWAAHHMVKYEGHHDQDEKGSTVVLRSINEYHDEIEGRC